MTAKQFKPNRLVRNEDGEEFFLITFCYDSREKVICRRKDKKGFYNRDIAGRQHRLETAIFNIKNLTVVK